MFSGASDKQASIDEGAPSDLHGADDENANAGDESESLSDIDDVEVCKLVWLSIDLEVYMSIPSVASFYHVIKSKKQI